MATLEREFATGRHSDAPLNEIDASTLFGGGAKGYTDYPTLDEVATA